MKRRDVDYTVGGERERAGGKAQDVVEEEEDQQKQEGPHGPKASGEDAIAMGSKNASTTTTTTSSNTVDQGKQQ